MLPMHGGARVHHLRVVRTVDDGIELVVIDGYVVAHVAQLLHDVRIAGGVDVSQVFACLTVEEVDGGLVAAHVAFVEQEEPFYDFAARAARHQLLFFGVDERDVAPAACHDDGGEHEQKEMQEILFHKEYVSFWVCQNVYCTMPLKLVPGMGSQMTTSYCWLKRLFTSSVSFRSPGPSLRLLLTEKSLVYQGST